jgi:hypothetical protein
MLIALGLALASLTGCDKKEPSADEPSYGEPVGITMEASKDVPAFEVGVAVSKGVVVDPLVPPISSLLYKGLRACPDLVRVIAKEPVQIAFAVEQGRTRSVTVTGEAPDCVARTLTDQEVAGAGPAKLHVLAMIRLPSAKGQDAEGRKP